MSKYFTCYDSAQDANLEALISSHEAIVSVNDFEKLIEKLCALLRSSYKEKYNAQIWRDSFLGSLRRIYLAKCQYDEIPFDCEAKSHDLRMSWMLVFFQNAKVFLEVTKSNFSNFKSAEFNELIGAVTEIRNCFAHEYNKRHSGKLCVMRIDPNHHFNDGLLKLEMMDLDFSERFQDIYLSLEKFYKDFRDLLEKLILYIEKTNKS